MIVAIRIADPGAVAAQARGPLGAVAANVLPGYTESQVYQGVADQIAAALRQQGIAATVTVEADPTGDAPSLTPGVRDLVPLALGVALGYFIAD